MKYKFKIGDTVRLVGPSGPKGHNYDPTYGWFGWSQGDIATIVGIDPDPNEDRAQNYVLARKGRQLYWCESTLELVTPEA